MAEMTGPQEDLLDLFKQAIFDERVRAHAKHGATSMEQQSIHAHKRASVLTEEAVECARALNDHEHGAITLWDHSALPAPLGADGDELDKELIQTAAMAYTWWANRRGDRLEAPKPELRSVNVPLHLNADDEVLVRIGDGQFYGKVVDGCLVIETKAERRRRRGL